MKNREISKLEYLKLLITEIILKIVKSWKDYWQDDIKNICCPLGRTVGKSSLSILDRHFYVLYPQNYIKEWIIRMINDGKEGIISYQAPSLDSNNLLVAFNGRRYI